MERQQIFTESARYPAALPMQTLLNGKYTVGLVLGVGGFSITYLAWDEVLNIPVAIKEFVPAGLTTRGADQLTLYPSKPDEFQFGKERFLQEARTLAQLNHYNIVRVRDFFEAHGTAYFIMDYYEGQTLEEFMQRSGGRMSEQAVMSLFIPLLDGLREAHRKGVLHRDIKPANIYLARLDTGNVRPILLDFGAARFAIGERSKSISMIVTPGYAPYEQYQTKGDLGEWTDVYGAAATMYHAATGVQPPAAPDRFFQDELQNPAQFGLSEKFCSIVLKGLQLRPADRFPNIGALQDALLGNSAIPLAGQAPPISATRPIAPSPEPAPMGYDPNVTRRVSVPVVQTPAPSRPVAPATSLPKTNKPQTPAPYEESQPAKFNLWWALLVLLGLGGMGFVAWQYVLPSISASPEKLYETYKREGDEYLSKHEYANALRSFQAAQEKNPTEYVKGRIETLEKYSTALNEGDQQQAEAWFAKALLSYQTAQTVIPDSPEINERIQQTRVKLNQALQTARDFAQTYISVLNSGDTSALYNLYDEKVDYLNGSIKKREEVKAAIENDLNQYTNYTFSIPSAVDVEASTNLNRYKVLFDLRFEGDHQGNGVRKTSLRKKRFTLLWKGDRFLVTFERGTNLEESQQGLSPAPADTTEAPPAKRYDF